MAFEFQPSSTQVAPFSPPAQGGASSYLYLANQIQRSLEGMAERQLAQQQQEAQEAWLQEVAAFGDAAVDVQVTPSEFHEAGRLLQEEDGEQAFRGFYGDVMDEEQLDSAVRMMQSPRSVRVYDPERLRELASRGVAAGFKPSEVKTLISTTTGDAFAGLEDMRSSLTSEYRQAFSDLFPRAQVSKEQLFLGPSEPRDRVLASMADLEAVVPDWRDRLGHALAGSLEDQASQFFAGSKPVLSMTADGPQMRFAQAGTPTPDQQKMLEILNMAFDDPALSARAGALYGHGLGLSEAQLRTLVEKTPSFLRGNPDVPRGTSVSPPGSPPSLDFLKRGVEYAPGTYGSDEPEVSKELRRFMGGG